MKSATTSGLFLLSGVFFQPHRKRFGISGFHFLLTALRCLALGYKILFAAEFPAAFTSRLRAGFCKRFAPPIPVSIIDLNIRADKVRSGLSQQATSSSHTFSYALPPLTPSSVCATRLDRGTDLYPPAVMVTAWFRAIPRVLGPVCDLQDHPVPVNRVQAVCYC